MKKRITKKCMPGLIPCLIILMGQFNSNPCYSAEHFQQHLSVSSPPTSLRSRITHFTQIVTDFGRSVGILKSTQHQPFDEPTSTESSFSRRVQHIQQQAESLSLASTKVAMTTLEKIILAQQVAIINKRLVNLVQSLEVTYKTRKDSSIYNNISKALERGHFTLGDPDDASSTVITLNPLLQKALGSSAARKKLIMDNVNAHLKGNKFEPFGIAYEPIYKPSTQTTQRIPIMKNLSKMAIMASALYFMRQGAEGHAIVVYNNGNLVIGGTTLDVFAGQPLSLTAIVSGSVGNATNTFRVTVGGGRVVSNQTLVPSTETWNPGSSDTLITSPIYETYANIFFSDMYYISDAYTTCGIICPNFNPPCPNILVRTYDGSNTVSVGFTVNVLCPSSSSGTAQSSTTNPFSTWSSSTAVYNTLSSTAQLSTGTSESSSGDTRVPLWSSSSSTGIALAAAGGSGNTIGLATGVSVGGVILGAIYGTYTCRKNRSVARAQKNAIRTQDPQLLYMHDEFRSPDGLPNYRKFWNDSIQLASAKEFTKEFQNSMEKLKKQHNREDYILSLDSWKIVAKLIKENNMFKSGIEEPCGHCYGYCYGKRYTSPDFNVKNLRSLLAAFVKQEWDITLEEVASPRKTIATSLSMDTENEIAGNSPTVVEMSKISSLTGSKVNLIAANAGKSDNASLPVASAVSIGANSNRSESVINIVAHSADGTAN